MKSNLILKGWAVVGAAALVLATGREASAAGGAVTGASAGTATSTAIVTLSIPGIIGIDVESDANFNLTLLSAGAPGVCLNVFPPGAGCASATYTPTITNNGSLTTASGSIYVAILDTTAATLATKNIKHSISAAWSVSTGIATSDVQAKVSTANNGGVGAASFTALPTTATPMTGNASIPNGPFNWTRQDQQLQLVIPSSETPTATAGATATISYTFSRS